MIERNTCRECRYFGSSLETFTPGILRAFCHLDPPVVADNRPSGILPQIYSNYPCCRDYSPIPNLLYIPREEIVILGKNDPIVIYKD